MGTPPWDGGRGWRLKQAHPHNMCYHAEFGRFALKGVAYRKTPKIGKRCNFAVFVKPSRFVTKWMNNQCIKFYVLDLDSTVLEN